MLPGSSTAQRLIISLFFLLLLWNNTKWSNSWINISYKIRNLQYNALVLQVLDIQWVHIYKDECMRKIKSSVYTICNNLYWYSTSVELVHFERKKPLRNSYILIVLLNEYLYHLTINSSCAVTVDNFLFAKVHLMLSFFVFYGKIIFMIHVPCFSQIKSNSKKTHFIL